MKPSSTTVSNAVVVDCCKRGLSLYALIMNEWSYTVRVYGKQMQKQAIIFHKSSQNSAIFIFVSLLYGGQLSKERICSSTKKHDSVHVKCQKTILQLGWTTSTDNNYIPLGLWAQYKATGQDMKFRQLFKVVYFSSLPTALH